MYIPTLRRLLVRMCHIAWFIVTGITIANAASFDCKKAGTRIEKTICSDSQLSGLDDKLGNAYAEALKNSPDKSWLVKQQRRWMRARTQCENTKCLAAKYNRQINFLSTVYGCNTHNVIANLPDAIAGLVPQDLGIESFAMLKMPETNTTLIAAIAAPIWNFNLCSANLPEGVTTSRMLLVWRRSGTGWKQIGKSDKVLFSVDTAGQTDVKVSTSNGQFQVENSATSATAMRWLWYENYTLAFDKNADRIRLVKWESSQLQYPMSGGGIGYKEFDEATEKYGEERVCDSDGYMGKINYSSRLATIEQCKFAQPKVKARSFQVPSGPISLEEVASVRFDKLPYIANE
jgi:uncharacterized protein